MTREGRVSIIDVLKKYVSYLTHVDVIHA